MERYWLGFWHVLSSISILCILGCSNTSVSCMNFRLTSTASKEHPSFRVMLGLQDRATAIVVTLCTYPMRGFGSLARFFKRIYDAPIAPWRAYQLVALLLFFPCFYISDFFFKIAYSLNHHRLLRLGRECARLGGQDHTLKLNYLSLHFSQRINLN